MYVMITEGAENGSLSRHAAGRRFKPMIYVNTTCAEEYSPVQCLWQFAILGMSQDGYGTEAWKLIKQRQPKNYVLYYIILYRWERIWFLQ